MANIGGVVPPDIYGDFDDPPETYFGTGAKCGRCGLTPDGSAHIDGVPYCHPWIGGESCYVEAQRDAPWPRRFHLLWGWWRR